MPASKAQRAATAERRGKAIAMKLAGLDYQTIANRLGYPSRGAAYTDIERALVANIAQQRQSVEEYREVELLRLDRLQAASWQAAAGGDLPAILTVLRIIDRRCKLLGLDAPVKAEVVTLDYLDAAIREAEAALGGGTSAGAPALPPGAED